MRATIEKVNKFLDVLAQYHEDDDTFGMMVAGISVHLQGICMGAERIFSQIANDIDGYMPTGSGWQQKLIKQMAHPIFGKRSRVIRSDTLGFLLELRGFKVAVRGGFGDDLNDQEVIAMALRLPECYEVLKADCLAFHQGLEKGRAPSAAMLPPY